MFLNQSKAKDTGIRCAVCVFVCVVVVEVKTVPDKTLYTTLAKLCNKLRIVY